MLQQHLPHSHDEKTPKVLEFLPDAGDFQPQAALFQQLADGNRLRIFWLLCHCEECVTNLSARVGMSSPAVSHHLRQLKLAGLIVNRRDGKEVYYTAADHPTAHILHTTLETLLSMSCPHKD